MDASDQATFDALKDTIVFELRAQLAMRESGLDLREIEAIAEMVADQVLTEHEVIRRAEAEPFPRRRDRAAPVSAPDIVAAIALEPYVVRVFFADGQLRDVDIEPLLESPIFGQLRDHTRSSLAYTWTRRHSPSPGPTVPTSIRTSSTASRPRPGSRQRASRLPSLSKPRNSESSSLREAAARQRARVAIRGEVRRLAADERDRDEMRIVRELLAELAPRWVCGLRAV